MNSNIQSFLFFLIMTGFFCSGLKSQDASIAPDAGHYKRNSVTAKQTIKSSEQQQIEAEITRLKREDNPANISRILELNGRLEEINPVNRTITIPYTGGGMRYNSMPLSTESGGDFVSNARIFSNPGEVRGIAACIEQRGANAGRIWVTVVYSAGVNSPDTFKVLYSADNGLSWSQYVSGNIRPLDKVSAGDIDMELIENSTGQKYLWTVFGYRQNGGTGAWGTGGFVLQFPSFNGAFFNALSWPGADTTKRYYDIKLTTDNAHYGGSAYLYMICSFDSVNTNGVRVNSQKFARCLNPYTVSGISFSYMGPGYYWSDATAPAGYQRTLSSDICYFNNGAADSLEVSFSGAGDSTKLFFAKSDINGNRPVQSAGAGGPVGGSESGDYKTAARLSSNGNDNGSVVCVFRQYTAGNWFTKWFRTGNYGNFDDIASQSVLWGSSTNVNYEPDIISVRNGNTHYVTFTTNGTEDSVHYLSVNSMGEITHNPKMNYFTATEKLSPKAIFRYQNGDSCAVFYSENNSANMIVVTGCTGEPIGIVNNSIPLEYMLEQNYPNPFNPLTTIKFSIAKAGIVKLTLYDLLGNEIEVLANKYYQAGNVSIDFNAAKLASGVYFYKLVVGDNTNNGFLKGFSSVKKMVLLK